MYQGLRTPLRHHLRCRSPEPYLGERAGDADAGPSRNPACVSFGNVAERTGPLVLILWAVGWLAIPFLALVIDDENLGVFIVTAIMFGPLAFLLVRSGSRDDGRKPSSGLRRRSRGLAVVACALAVLTATAAVVGNPGWIACYWIAVFAFSMALSWGFRMRSEPSAP